MHNIKLSRVLFLFVAFSVLLISAACRRNPTATPTAGAPIPITMTPSPIAPTAPPLTAMPTDIPTQVIIPTATPLVASPVPTDTVSSQAPTGTAPGSATGTAISTGTQSKGGIYITRLRLDPPTPHNKENVTFYASFTNTTGRDVNTAWCVEIFRPRESKSFGITKCDLKIVPKGLSEQAALSWQIAGIRDCIPLLARAVVRGPDDARTPFVLPNGKAYWVNFTACP